MADNTAPVGNNADHMVSAVAGNGQVVARAVTARNLLQVCTKYTSLYGNVLQPQFGAHAGTITHKKGRGPCKGIKSSVCISFLTEGNMCNITSGAFFRSTRVFSLSLSFSFFFDQNLGSLRRTVPGTPNLEKNVSRGLV